MTIRLGPQTPRDPGWEADEDDLRPHVGAGSVASATEEAPATRGHGGEPRALKRSDTPSRELALGSLVPPDEGTATLPRARVFQDPSAMNAEGQERPLDETCVWVELHAGGAVITDPRTGESVDMPSEGILDAEDARPASARPAGAHAEKVSKELLRAASKGAELEELVEGYRKLYREGALEELEDHEEGLDDAALQDLGLPRPKHDRAKLSDYLP